MVTVENLLWIYESRRESKLSVIQFHQRLTEKIEDFEFALSRLPVEERDCAKVKLQAQISSEIGQVTDLFPDQSVKVLSSL